MYGSNADRDYGVATVGRDIVSNTILTSDTNGFLVVGEGVVIEDVIAQTDSVGLAGSTNFQLKAGSTVFFSSAVSGLGANAVVDLDRASVTKGRIAVPGNTYIKFSGTVGAGTGAGVATVRLKYRRLDSNSSIQVA